MHLRLLSVSTFSIFVGLLVLGGGPVAAQNYSLAANAGDMLELGTLGLEASVGLSQHWSATAGAKFNPWTFRSKDTYNGLYNDPNPDQMQDRRQQYSLGARFWPWHVFSGLWIGGKAQYEEYNRGGLLNDRTTEGDAFGGALSGGYSLMIRDNINLDFGVGLWGGWTKYTTYNCPSCGTVLDKGSKMFLLPNEVILAFVYIF